MHATKDAQSTTAVKRILALVWRGWTKACPVCGERGLFERWFTLRERCPNCRFQFEREDGYWTGAMAANIIVTELTFVALMILGFVATWPDPPVPEMIVGGILFNIAFPMVFYPFSKTIWMAFDLTFRPLHRSSDQRER